MTIDPMPSWLNPVPFGDVGRGELPGNPQQRDVLSEDQLQQMRNQLLESILSSVVQAVRGLFVPGPFGAALQQLEEWAGDLPGSFADILTWIQEKTGLDFTDPGLFLSSLVTRLVDDVEGFVTQVSNALWALAGFANDLWAGLNEATGLTWDAGPLDFVTSLAEKIFDTFQIDLGSPEDLFNSIQSNIGTVFTTIGGVLSWVESETGLNFSQGPENFIQSLINTVLDGFGVDLNGPYELWASITNPLETILSLSEGALTNFLGNLTVFFNGLPNIFDGSFNLQSAVQSFLTDTLGIAQIGAAGLQFVESLIPNVLGALDDFFDNVASFLGIDLRQIASGDFIPGLAFITFLTNIKDVLLEWIRFYVFGGVQTIGEWVEDNIFNPIAQTFLGGLKLPPALLGVTEIAEAGLGVLGDIAGTLLTSLTAIPAALLEGILPPGLLGQVPVSNISDTSPNLINLGAFAEAGNIEAADGWSWDATSNAPGSAGGSAKFVIDQAGDHYLYSRQAVPVGKGDRLVLSAKVLTSGLTVSSGGSTPITIALVPFIGSSQQTPVPVGTARGSTTSWSSVGNAADDPYVVTNADWTSVIVRLTVASTATAGTVWWDEVSLTKTGKLVQDNVDSLVDAWNSMIGGLEGLGESASGYDWTRLFTSSANARQQGTVAQSRLDNTNTNLFGTPLGGTTFAPENLPTLISNLAAVKVDGNATMSNFLDGLLSGFGVQLPPGGATVDDVATGASALTNTANTASQAASTAGTNIQSTWDELYDAFGGTTGSTNRTLAETRNRGAAVRNSAVTGEANASTALSNAATAQGTADTAVSDAATAQGAAVAAQTAASTADGKAVAAQDQGVFAANQAKNLTGNLGFENNSWYISPYCEYSAEVVRSGSLSCKATAPGVNFWVWLSTDRTGVRPYPAAPGDVWYIEASVYGHPDNDGGATFYLYAQGYNAAGQNVENLHAGSVNANTDGEWVTWSGYRVLSHPDIRTLRVGIYCVSQAGNVYYVDDPVVRIVTDGYYAQQDADAAQADAATGIANAATAQGAANTAADAAATADAKAVTADGKAVAAQGTADTANTAAGTANTNLQTTVDYLYDAFNGSSGSTNVQRSTMRDRGAAVRSTAVTGAANASTALTNAATAQTAANTADGKAVAAQSAADAAAANAAAAQALLDAAVTSGTNLVPDPSFENPALDARRLKCAGTYEPWWQHTDEEVHTGSRSLKLTYYGNFPEMRLTPSLVSYGNFPNGVRENWIPTEVGRTYYVSQWVYLKSPNNGTRQTNLYLMTYNESVTSPGYVAVVAYPPLDTWTRIEGFLTINDADAKYMAPLFGTLRPGNDTGAVMYLDDCEIIDVTEAYNAKLEAEAAQATANTGVTNAALAQTAANTADGKAVAAQSTADKTKSLTKSVLSSGSNIFANPSFENTDFSINAGATRSYSTEVARTGTRSVKQTGYAYWYLFTNDTGTYWAPCVAGDWVYVEAYIYGHPNNVDTTSNSYIQVCWINAAGAQISCTNATGWNKYGSAYNGVWTKMSGVVQAPAGAVGFNPVPVQNSGGSPQTNIYYWDDVDVRIITEAYNAQQDADAAQADAATGIANAATAQGAANAAQTAADTADGKAVVAQSAISDRVASGQNLVFEGGFENAAVWPLSGQWSRSTAYKRNGSYSARVVANGVTQSLGLNRNLSTTVNWNTAAGRKYYLEFWVYAPTSNTGTAGLIQLWSAVRTTGGSWVYNPGGAPGTYVSNLTKGVWTKFWGIINLDNVVDAFYWYPYLRVDGSTTSGEFYFDDVYITDITDAYNAQLDADAAQADASTGIANAATAQTTANSRVPQTFFDAAQRGGDNLCTNPVFSDTSQYLWTANASYSTDYTRTGTHSAKVSNNGTSDYYVSVINRSDNSGNAYVTTYPGQVFYCEFYVYQTGGSNSSTVSMYVQLFDWDLTYRSGQLQIAPTFTAANNNQWTKVSGFFIVPAPPAGQNYAQARFLLRSHSNTAAGTVRYFDDVIVRDVTEAYYAQLDADLGITNAATADGKAVLAQNAAATADGKAVAAQTATDLASLLWRESTSAGNNLIPDPGFENAALDAVRLAGGTFMSLTASWSYDNSSRGLRCLKHTFPGGTVYPSANLSPSLNANDYIPVEPGRVFLMSQYIYAANGNTGSGECNMYLQTKYANGTINWQTAQFFPTKGSWNLYEKLFVMPANAVEVLPLFCAVRPGNAQGDIFWVDDVALFDVTEAYYAQESADAAQASANTGIANAATAQGAADTAASAAATADGKAVAAQTNFTTYLYGGQNLLPNPSYENTSYALNYSSAYSTEQSRSGARSVKISGTGAVQYPQIGGSARIKAVAGQVFAYEFWAYGHGSNTITGTQELISFGLWCYDKANVYQANVRGGATIDTLGKDEWRKFYGTLVIPDDPDIVEVQPLFYVTQFLTANNFVYVDDVVLRDVTEAYYAQGTADQGVEDAAAAALSAANAATVGSTAALAAAAAAQDAADAALAAVNAQNAADTADGKAVDARTDFRLSRRNGINLIPNPSFEDTRYPVPYATFTTEDAHWGSRSLKLTSAGSPLYPQPLVDEFGTYRIECVANQYFYYEFWIKGHADNSKFTGTEEVCSFGFWLHRKDGSYYTAIRDVVRFDQVGKGNWVKISGVRQMPNVDFIGQILVLMYCPAIPSGDIYYLDDFVLRDITEAQAAQLDADSAFSSASTAQSAANTAKSAADLAAATASSALASGDNLIPNSGFEQPATLWAQAGGSISDFTARTGSKSLKLTGSGSPYAYLFNGATSLYELPCKSEDVFKFSYWVRGVTGNTTCTARFGIATFNEAGSNVQYHIYDYAVAASTSWVQITGTITVPTTTNTRFRPYLQVLSNPGNTMYFDDVVLERITEVAATNKALYGQNTPGTAIQTDAVPTLPQAKVSGLPVGFLVEDELAQHAAEISELKAAREVSINQGKTISVNFANYSNSSSLPTTGSQRWSTTYSGSGTATWGISNGKAAWIGSTSVARTAKVIYLGDGTAGSEKTLTDYQVLRGVLQNPPLNQEFTAMARVSDDGNTYVWAKAIATLGFFTVNVTGSIGCVVNGVSTTWQSNIPLTWSTEMTLKCGVDGDPRKFQVFSGTTLVTQYTESGTSSGLGAGYRRFGAIAKCGNNATSGTISSVTVSDNPPVVYAGSVARMSRTNTGNDGDFTTSVTPLPNNPPSYTFFDQVDFESLDIDADLNTGSFTVSKGGMYRISARAQFASGVGINNCALVLQRSTNGGSTWVSEQFGGNSYVAADGNWLQYLEAGDKVRLATWRTAGNKSNAMVGEATGARTFFTISGNSN